MLQGERLLWLALRVSLPSVNL